MLRNLLTLKKMANELSFLKKSKVIECFTQEKNIVLISFFDGTSQCYLELNLINSFESIFYHKSFHRARINSVDLFNEIIGLNLSNITVYQNDRIFQLHFEKVILNIFLFGFSKNNIVLTDDKLNLLKTFKQKGEFSFNNFLNSKNINTLSDYLLNLSEYFSKDLVQEFCFQNNFDPKKPIENFDQFQIKQIEVFAKKFIKNVIDEKRSFILINSNKDLKFSLIPLNYFGEIYLELNNINEGIRRFKSERISHNNFDLLYDSYKKKLEKIDSKFNKQLINIDTLLKNKHLISDYKLFGEILMAFPSPKSKGPNDIIAMDWENNERKIKLNKDKTILENAQSYFEKSKKLKDEIEIKSTWISSINFKKEQIEKLLAELDKINNIKELKKFETKMKEIESDSNKAIESAESDKFRVFDLGAGFILYVGKSASNNDELTMKFAKANDLWMHARGAAGSHAVIRLKKEENPPKEIIKKAASIVAYYSQARNAKYVPVCYTFKKYVRKPKGANPGSVVLQKETVVMVEPKLPD